MIIESIVYREFYIELKLKIRTKFPDRNWDVKAHGENSIYFWLEFEEEEYKDYFGGFGTSNRKYFYKKYFELNPKNTPTGQIDDLAFSKALSFIDLVIPDSANNEFLSTQDKAKILYNLFIEKYIKKKNNQTKIETIPFLPETHKVSKNLEIKKQRENMNLSLYKPIFENTEWWLFLYSRNSDDRKETWDLTKLLLRFENVTEEQIPVTIKNIESYDYSGEINLAESQVEIIIINVSSIPYYSRHVNIKLNVGKGSGEIFLGQYLSYESDGYIISGTVILQSVTKNKSQNESPRIYQIPKQEKYANDIEGVNKSILQYLHDKKQNFHRTPIKGSHSLSSFEKWVEENNL